MPRYIDADALLERMKHTPRYFDIKFDIEQMPTADVVPRNKGHWMTYHCTNDGRSPRGRTIIYKTYTCDACGTSNGRRKTPYCPNCGAKMKGGAE